MVTRRQLIKAAGAGLTVSVAGCSSKNDGGAATESATESPSDTPTETATETPTESPTDTPTETETDTATPEPVPTVAFAKDQLNPGFSREAWENPEGFEVPSTTVQVGNVESMENTKLILERLKEGEVQQVEKDLNQNGSAEIRSNELAEGAYRAVLENESGERVEPEPHEGQEDVEIVKDSVDHKRIDVHTPDTEEKTPYRHDNYTHKPGEFKKEYEDKWTRDAAFTGEYVENDPGLIQKLKKDEDIIGFGAYPNSEGYWDSG
ncbi:MAG: hypothetical protein ABEI53_03560, partial [Candidatus Magasanikbacteria bacterium]